MASYKSQQPRALPPDVKAALEEYTKIRGSQTAVAKDLGISTAVVSHLLSDRYPGDVDKMAERIRGHYMNKTVSCPVMGTLGRRHCLDYQVRPLAHTNPTRVQLYHACKTCPNNNKGGGTP